MGLDYLSPNLNTEHLDARKVTSLQYSMIKGSSQKMSIPEKPL